MENSLLEEKKTTAAEVTSLERVAHCSLKSETDSDIQYLFEQLNDVTRLTIDSRLNSTGTITLGSFFKKISQVTHFSLILHSNNIGCSGIKGIANGLSYLKKIQEFSIIIEPNSIEEQGYITFFIELSKLTSLQFLSINLGHKNNINYCGALYFALCISKLTNLIKLKAIIGRENSMSLESLSLIFQGLHLLQKIESFNLEIDIKHTTKQRKKQDLQSQKNIQKGQFPFNFENLGYESIYLSLMKLQHLKEFSIAIPLTEDNGILMLFQGLSALTNLQKLELLFNWGQIVNSLNCSNLIGQVLLTLPLLQELQLILCQSISEESGRCLAYGLGSLKNLKILNLTFEILATLNRQISFDIFSSLKNLVELSELQITVNQCSVIGVEGCSALAQALTEITRLNKLSLNFTNLNSIECEGAQALGQGISNQLLLSELTLNIGNANNITTAGAESLCDGINKLVKLKNLSFQIQSENQLNSSIINYVNEKFQTLCALEKFDLLIDAPDVSNYSVKEALSKMIHLRELTLTIMNQNKISNNLHIGDSLASLINLTSLKIEINSGNSLGRVGAESIGKGFQNLINLRYLHLRIGVQNNISTIGAVAIVKGLENLIKLESIDLIIEEGNGVSSDKLLKTTAYTSLKEMPNLKNINLNISNDPSFFQMLPLIETNPHLTEENLNLAGFPFSFKKVYDIDSKKLKKFELDLYLKQVDDFQIALQGLESLSSLTNLQIYISEKRYLLQMDALERSLSYLQQLQVFNLNLVDYTCITDACMLQIIQAISQLSSLTQLEFQFNSANLTYKGFNHLSDGFSGIKQIKQLSLNIFSRNGDSRLDMLTNGLCELVNLEKFELIISLSKVKSEISLITNAIKHSKNLKSVLIQINSQSYSSNSPLNTLLQPLTDLANLCSLKLYFPKILHSEDIENVCNFTLNFKLLKLLVLVFKNSSKNCSILRTNLIQQNLRLVHLRVE